MFNPEIETLAPSSLRELQNRRLRDLLPRLQRRVPFYRDHWRGSSLDAREIAGVEDLPELPVTRKEHLRALYPFGLLATERSQVAPLGSGPLGRWASCSLGLVGHCNFPPSRAK